MHITTSPYSAWPLALLGVASSILAGLLFSPAASAEAQITLSPTSHRLTVAPSKTYEGSLTVINSGSEPMKVRVYPAPYLVQNESYDPVFSKETSRTQISRWINLEQDSYQLAPDEQVKVPFTIKTPSSIPDGGQYAAIFAETSEEPDGAIMRKKRVGMLVYAQSDGKTQEAGVAELSKPGFLQIASKSTVEQRLINKGNTDLTGNVTVTAKSLFGKELFSRTQQKVVLPETTRLVTTEWKDTPAIGLVKVSQTVEFANEKSTSNHWMLFITPTWLLIIGSIAVLTIGGITYAIRRTKKRPKIRRLR